MTSLRRRVGAFTLTLSMCVSLFAGSIPALAADDEIDYTKPELYSKPKLVMDYLGDNKTRSDGSLAPVGGINTTPTGNYVPNAVGADMLLHAPAAVDQASADNGVDKKWNGFLSNADVGDHTAKDTIFWMGIGIEDIDQFILSNRNKESDASSKGIQSLELGLYYNPAYVKPYVDTANGKTFADAMEEYNLASSPNTLTQWDSDYYTIINAVHDAEVENQLGDPIDKVAVGDPVTPTQGYGTEEFAYGTGWKLAYVSLEIDLDKLDAAQKRFEEKNHDPDDTFYIAMFPFVLQQYDPDRRLCIRLARNASAFSIGGGEDKGMGKYGDGSASYGNWDKYTYHDPQHDLKLMFDYTGDLNIFKNEREPEDQMAVLNVYSSPGNLPGGVARLIINNEPFSPPSQIAYGDCVNNSAYNSTITGLSGGEELRISAARANGFKVNVRIVRYDGNGFVQPTSITKTDDWTDEWTFIMPDGINVRVDVEFIRDNSAGTEYRAELEVIPASSATESVNTAQLTTPTAVTAVLGTGTDSIAAINGTTVTIAVKRNSDYNVKVNVHTANPVGDQTPTLTNISPDQSMLSYTFTMPSSDVKVTVEFELAEPHIATLVLDKADGNAKNTAQLHFTDGEKKQQSSGLVTGADPNTGPHHDPNKPNLKNNQIETRDNRTITVETHCDTMYQVKDVLVYKGDSQIPAVSVTPVPGKSGEYTFTMPNYDVKVVVVYERVKTYKVRLVLEGAQNNEGATLTGTDARGVYTITLDTSILTPDSMWVFGNASMGVKVFDDATKPDDGLSGSRTASVKVYYPSYTPPTLAPGTLQLPVSGSAGGGFSFNMTTLNDPSTEEVVVVVKFEDASGTPLIAHIREYDDTNKTPVDHAVWKALGHKKNITVKAGDVLPVKITVPKGQYISHISVYDDQGSRNGVTEVGALLNVPVSLTGIGYNNGQGGVEEAVFTMPGVNATLYIEYKEGPPPEEPEFVAAIRKYTTTDTIEAATLGEGTLTITNHTHPATSSVTTTTVTPPATGTAVTGTSVKAETGDWITATYTPASDSYVSGVTVECDVPGTNISWHFNATGGVEVTMPAANVVVTVKFVKKDASSTVGLKVQKDPAASDGNQVTVTTMAGATTTTVVDVAQSTNTYDSELVPVDVLVAPGHYISDITLFDGANTVHVPYPGSGYNGGAGGTVHTAFTMPTLQNGATQAVLTVYFKDSAVDPIGVTLVVDEPAGAGNTAELFHNGAPAPSAGNHTATGTASVFSSADAGDTVKVDVTTAAGYSIDMPVITTPTGMVSLKWTDVGSFEFTMPNEPVTVTVPFRTGEATEFYTTLVFRDGDGKSADGVARSIGTYGSYHDLDIGQLVYSRAAQAGEHIPYAVRIPDGYYISKVTVTPEKFNVTPSITGMIGTQSGGFAMPAGNNYLNIYLSKGWPDDVHYPITLHVDAPNDGVNYSYAVLTNTVASQTTGTSGITLLGQSTGNVPVGAADTSGVRSIQALDGQKMRVTLTKAAAHTLKSLTILDGSGNPVSYQWATDSNQLAVEFSVPGSSVDVYVVYEMPKTPPMDHKVTLHLDPTNPTTTATLTNTVSTAQTTVDGGSFNAGVGDDITLTLAGSTALVEAAYAVTAEGAMVNLTPPAATDPTLAGSYVDQVQGKAYHFAMPFNTDVDVYLKFNETATPPGAGEHTLTLMVTGPVVANANQVTVREYNAVDDTPTGKTMSAAAVGGDAMVVKDGSTIRAEVAAAPGCALYSLVAYTAAGERVVVSFDKGSISSTWPKYIFTMPADTTHIEAEFRRVEEKAYQIQVVVNNEVGGGQNGNDANLYDLGDLTPFKFRDGVSAGEMFDLCLTVESGYQVESIIAVPQGSGVAANIPLPATYDQRTQVKMPASNLVIYVTFKRDVTTRFKVTGQISYPGSTVTPPNSPDRNEVMLTGKGSNEQDVATSNSEEARKALIHEAQGQRVEAVWTCADGYAVSSYTVTEDATGKIVLSEPMYDDSGKCIGLYLMMPMASVTVDVEFTKPDVEKQKEFSATLHIIAPDAADSASITGPGTPATVNTDGGVMAGLHVGDRVSISATPDAARYVQTIYVLQRSPMGGQMITFPDTSGLNYATQGAASSAYFGMPSGDVDVYVVFTANEPDPSKDFTATVKVNGNGVTDFSDPNNYAVLSGTFQGKGDASASAVNTPHAIADGASQSILVNYATTVTLTVTVDNFHEIDSVVCTPIGLLLTPVKVTSTATTTTYTFTMPASNVGVIVNLKEVEATKYDLRLHVVNQLVNGATPVQMEEDNETILSYAPADTTSTLIVAGAIPNSNNSVVPILKTPANELVTLTVKPQSTTDGDYFVRAAYVVHDNKVIPLTPTAGGSHFPYGLEKTLPADVSQAAGVPGVAGTDPNTATFTMPAGYTDVYVVYERGVPPTEPWYNVVVMATDTGGTKANSGKNNVTGRVATDPVPPTDALRTTTAPSDGSGGHFFTVSAGDQVRIDATGNHKDYRYDDTTGMLLSYQNNSMSPLTLTNADPSNHPLGEIQEFTMPSATAPIGNVGVHVNFVTTGAAGLTATLHVVRSDPDKVPGWPKNAATLSVGNLGNADYRFVTSQVEDGVKNVLTDLVQSQTITTKIQPKDPGTRVVQVVVTYKEANGAIGSVQAYNSGNDVYTYVMTDKSVDVYVVLAAKDDTDRFVATAYPTYDTGVDATNGKNKITAVTNTTDPTMNASPYWTEIKAGDQVKVDFTAETGVYVEVVAVRTGTSTPVKVAQFGTGNGSAGYAYVQTPTPGCNVTIEVRFSTTPPPDRKLTFESEDHGGVVDNVAKLDKDKDGTVESTLTPTAGVTTKLSETLKDPVTPGTALGVDAETAAGYTVEKVYVTTNDVTVHFILDWDAQQKPFLKDTQGNKVELQMPTTDATITVYFKEEDSGLRPYDPENTTDKGTKYEKNHWIIAENRGDYLIVTVPMLNNDEGSKPTSVVWKDEEKETDFRFYILDEATDGTKTYTSIDSVITMTRPEEAPKAVGKEPYWLGNFYTDPGPDKKPDTADDVKYDGARFILTVKDDETLDKIADATEKAKAKALAERLRQILDNDGTKKTGNKESLYITSVETAYVDKKPGTPVESDKVDLEVPRYYALTGILESYAPTHEAVFTLAGTKDGDPTFTYILKGESGYDLWQQDFKLKLTSKFDELIKDRTFTLAIEKAGHVTWFNSEIKLDKADTNNYNSTDLSFFFTNPIRLFGGDLDGNGAVKERDIGIMEAFLFGGFPATTVEKEGESGWDASVYNPASPAYVADLNGDGQISERDLNILMDPANYNFGEADYGAPSGLDFQPPALPAAELAMLLMKLEADKVYQLRPDTELKLPGKPSVEEKPSASVGADSNRPSEGDPTQPSPDKEPSVGQDDPGLPSSPPDDKDDVYHLRSDVELRLPEEDDDPTGAPESSRPTEESSSPDDRDTSVGADSIRPLEEDPLPSPDEDEPMGAPSRRAPREDKDTTIELASSAPSRRAPQDNDDSASDAPPTEKIMSNAEPAEPDEDFDKEC